MIDFESIRRVGVAKEMACEENPGGHDQRVVLTPSAVAAIVGKGFSVSVQRGAGEGVGFGDDAYVAAGARIVEHDELYGQNELIVKYKGPSLDNIAALAPGSVLMCMAHVDAFPERERALRERGVHVVALEHVAEWRVPLPYHRVLAGFAGGAIVGKLGLKLGGYDVYATSYTPTVMAVLRDLARKEPRSLTVLSRAAATARLQEPATTPELVIYDTAVDHVVNPGDFARVGDLRTYFDISSFEAASGRASAAKYYALEEPPEFGARRVHCLRETGSCAMAYALGLLESSVARKDSVADVDVLVLGYGNVAEGAVEQAHARGCRSVRILGRHELTGPDFAAHLGWADIVVNAAEQDPHLRGRSFHITDRNVEHDMRKGTVLIDLIGGSAAKQSPVEPLSSTTFLPDIHFVRHGVFAAALWGWDLAGAVMESTLRYSDQVSAILLGKDGLLARTGEISPGITRAFWPPREELPAAERSAGPVSVAAG